MSVWLGLLAECAGLAVALARLVRRRPRLRDALPYLGAALFVAADVFYEMRSGTLPRYPYNYGVECMYLGALSCIGLWVGRLLWHPASAALASPHVHTRPDRFMRGLGVGVATALSGAIGWAEWHYLLTPLHTRAGVGLMGVALATLYAGLHAVVTALVTMAVARTRRWWLFATFHGLGCMLAGDFASRYAALACDNSFGMGTFWWTLGLVGFVASLAATPVWGAADNDGARRAAKADALLTPTASVQVIVATSTSATTAMLLLAAKRNRWLFCAHAADFGDLLLCCWLAFAAMTGLSLFIGYSLRRGAHLLPRPRLQLRGDHHRLALRVPKAALRLSEMQSLARAHRRLLLELNDLVRFARHRAAQAKVGLLAAEWVHELQAPLAAMEAATSLTAPHANPNDTSASRALLINALARARGLSARVLHSTESAASASVSETQDGRRRRRPRLRWAAVKLIVERSMAEARHRHEAYHPQLVLWSHLPPIVHHKRFALRSAHLCVALGALLDNAIEASAPSHAVIDVHLTFRWRQAALVVAVLDRGVGLPTAMLLQAGRTRVPSIKMQGHGIGLLGAARRAAGWGGALQCYRRRGGGARVELLLPALSEKNWQSYPHPFKKRTCAG